MSKQMFVDWNPWCEADLDDELDDELDDRDEDEEDDDEDAEMSEIDRFWRWAFAEQERQEDARWRAEQQKK